MSYGSLSMKMRHLKRCQLSKSNTFDQDLMKLCQIVLYHDVFFKIDYGPYCTMLSRATVWLFVYEHSLFQTTSALSDE